MGAVIGAECRVGRGAQVSPARGAERTGGIQLGKAVQIGDGVLLHPFGGSITIAENVYVGPYSVIYGHGGVHIGKGTLIAMHCRILSSNHEVPPMGTPVRSRPDRVAPTQIGEDVWLGAGVTILAGVTLGDGCIVGAGAVVTNDVPSGQIVVGVPARAVGRRPGSAIGGMAGENDACY